MKSLIYVTGNSYKFETAKEILNKSNISLIQKDIDTPEIQSTEVEEIAKYSAKWAAEKLNHPVLVTDGGFYIEALNGFPGPFIKYINKWLTSDQILKLMEGIQNRKIIVKECLAYCEPGNEPKTFTSILEGKIALQKGKSGRTSINEIFIPDGLDKVESEIENKDMLKFWSKFDYWTKFVKFFE